MMTMTVGHRIALWVVTSLVALMMVVVGPGVSAASRPIAPMWRPSTAVRGTANEEARTPTTTRNTRRTKRTKGAEATLFTSPAVAAPVVAVVAYLKRLV